MLLADFACCGLNLFFAGFKYLFFDSTFFFDFVWSEGRVTLVHASEMAICNLTRFSEGKFPVNFGPDYYRNVMRFFEVPVVVGWILELCCHQEQCFQTLGDIVGIGDLGGSSSFYFRIP